MRSSVSRGPLMQRESPCLVQQDVRQSQSSSEDPLCWGVPATINARVAGLSDSGGEPRHVVHLFRNKLDAERDGRCWHELTTHVREFLSELALELSSLVVNQPSRHAKGSDPVFEEVIPHDLRMLAGNLGNNTKKSPQDREC